MINMAKVKETMPISYLDRLNTLKKAINELSGEVEQIESELGVAVKKTDVIDVAHGGTGATDYLQANANLGLGDTTTNIDNIVYNSEINGSFDVTTKNGYMIFGHIKTITFSERSTDFELFHFTYPKSRAILKDGSITKSLIESNSLAYININIKDNVVTFYCQPVTNISQIIFPATNNFILPLI